MSRTHEELALENFNNAYRASTHEWCITMLFYAAVHAAEHVLHPSGAPESGYDHDRRNHLIRANPRLKTIRRQYEELKNLSRFARYIPARHPMEQTQKGHATYLARHILKVAGLPPPT